MKIPATGECSDPEGGLSFVIKKTKKKKTPPFVFHYHTTWGLPAVRARHTKAHVMFPRKVPGKYEYHGAVHPTHTAHQNITGIQRVVVHSSFCDEQFRSILLIAEGGTYSIPATIFTVENNPTTTQVK